MKKECKRWTVQRKPRPESDSYVNDKMDLLVRDAGTSKVLRFRLWDGFPGDVQLIANDLNEYEALRCIHEFKETK